MAQQKSKPSHIYSSISVAIVMFLLGLFVLILLHAHNLTNIIKEKMNIVVELVHDQAPDKIVEQLKSLYEVKQESVTFLPKEKAMTQMRDRYEIQFSEEENPFRDVIIFNVRSSEYSTEKILSIKTMLENYSEVDQVYYEDITIENIKSNLNRVAYAVLGIGLIFVFLAIVIIRNTINLSMYADRWEIKTMELIGAKWRFIKMPYIKTGVLVGFRAFILASIFLMGLLILSKFYLPQVWEIINFFYILITLLVIFTISILIPALATNSAASKYLNTNMASMYE